MIPFKRLSQMDRKWFVIILVSLIVVMVINRLFLSDVYYLISAALMGMCGAGMYFSIYRAKNPR